MANQLPAKAPNPVPPTRDEQIATEVAALETQLKTLIRMRDKDLPAEIVRVRGALIRLGVEANARADQKAQAERVRRTVAVDPQKPLTTDPAIAAAVAKARAALVAKT